MRKMLLSSRASFLFSVPLPVERTFRVGLTPLVLDCLQVGGGTETK